MPHVDPGQALTIFIGNLPTFIAVILAWMHSNGRLSDMNARMADLRIDLQRQIQDTRQALSEKIDFTRDLLRAELRRVEEVLDARLKHLEEHEH